MNFNLTTALFQLINLILLGLIIFAVIAVVKHFRSNSKKLDKLEEKMDQVLECQNTKEEMAGKRGR